MTKLPPAFIITPPLLTRLQYLVTQNFHDSELDDMTTEIPMGICLNTDDTWTKVISADLTMGFAHYGDASQWDDEEQNNLRISIFADLQPQLPEGLILQTNDISIGVTEMLITPLQGTPFTMVALAINARVTRLPHLIK